MDPETQAKVQSSKERGTAQALPIQSVWLATKYSKLASQLYRLMIFSEMQICQSSVGQPVLKVVCIWKEVQTREVRKEPLGRTWTRVPAMLLDPPATTTQNQYGDPGNNWRFGKLLLTIPRGKRCLLWLCDYLGITKHDVTTPDFILLYCKL